MKVRIREEHVYSCSILHSSIPALCVIPQIWPHKLTHIHLVINRETWHSLHLQATSIHYTQNKVTFSHFFFLMLLFWNFSSWACSRKKPKRWHKRSGSRSVQPTPGRAAAPWVSTSHRTVVSIIDDKKFKIRLFHIKENFLQRRQQHSSV